MASDHSKRDTSVLADRQNESSRRPIWQRVPKGWIALVLLLLAWIAGYLVFQGAGLLLG